MVKKVVQQGRSDFDARSVLSVREHDKMARTPLVAFFNIPLYTIRRWEKMNGAQWSVIVEMSLIFYAQSAISPLIPSVYWLS
jgi:hypothetical protein